MSNHIVQGKCIVAAAVKFILKNSNSEDEPKDIVIVGVRHYDMVMRDILKTMWDMVEDKSNIKEGFIDSMGEWHDRKESLRIALEAGQINIRRKKTQPYDQLFSEDLY